MLEASGNAVAQLVTELVGERKLTRPTLVSVGGGAGGLGRYVADLLGLPCVVPEGAEVISSIGDALSLVSATRERAIENPSVEDIDALVREVENEALASGASPASVTVRTEYVGERRALRVVATGAIGLEAGAVPGREAADEDEMTARMTGLGVEARATRCGSYWVGRGDHRVVVLDRFADLVVAAEGEIVDRHEGEDLRRPLEAAIRRNTKTMGPVRVEPSVWVVADTRVTELGAGDVVETAVRLVVDGATLIVGRA
jgi:hypothetical protein